MRCDGDREVNAVRRCSKLTLCETPVDDGYTFKKKAMLHVTSGELPYQPLE